MTGASRLIGAIGALVVAGCSRGQEPATTAPEITSPPTTAPAITGSLTTAPEAASYSSPYPEQTMPTLRIADKHGIVSIGQGAVDPKRLHVPLYPGATQSSGFGSFSDSDSHGSTAITTLDAHASFELVVAWYKTRVPAGAHPTRLSVGGETTASYEWTSGDGRADHAVTINTNHGKPVITISERISNGSP